MDLNGTQHGEEACSRTEESPSDPDHRIDVHGSHDAKTIDRILADLKSLEEQVKAIQEAPRPAKKFTVHGKLLESVIAEEGAEENLESIAAFKRLKNRLWIKENTVYDELLQDAEGSYNLITQRVDRREKRVEELTNQVFNLVGFFSVFQGVILTAVTQLSTSVTTHLGATQARPLCGKVWVPVVLSALAAVASVVAVILKFKHLYTLDDSISDEKHYQSTAANKAETLRRKGPDFKFDDICDRKKKPTSTYWGLKCLAVIGALIVFTVLLILSYFVILCDKWVLPGWN